MRHFVLSVIILICCASFIKIEANAKPSTGFINEIPTLNPEDKKWEWMDRQIENDFKAIEHISVTTLLNDFSNIQMKEEEFNPQPKKIFKKKQTKSTRTFKKLKTLRTSPSWAFSYIRCYEIKNGVVYGIDDHFADFLEAIVARYPVPDLVFLYFQQDLIRADFFENCHFNTPILCSVKLPGTEGKIIHFIDWLYHIAETGAGWNKMISDIDEKRPQSPWEEKIPMLFWRGATTCKHLIRHTDLHDFPRGKLVQLSLDCPSLIDARFNRVFNPEIQGHFPQAPFTSLRDHLNYKYQLTMDGETATYPGYQWRLYSGCLNFKQDSDDTMWFYGALEPYVHYVPVQRNLEDLVEKLEWAMENDEKALEIAQNARKFAEENLLPEHMLLYAYKVLSKYASKLEK